MSTEVIFWWLMLCAVSIFNVGALCYSTHLLRRRQTMESRRLRNFRRMQLLLCAGYVLGCAYRSVLPVFDIQRMCVVDTWLSSVLIGRSVATIAELCFAAQWMLLLRELAMAARCRICQRAAFAVLPIIAIAETCSWYSVLTTSNIGHVIEESLWGLAASLLVAMLLFLREQGKPALRPLLMIVSAAGAAYVAYMFLVDVPMYWSRWSADEELGRHYLSITEGVRDVSSRWVVSQRWEDWKSEVIWMTLYFSVGVWLSISLVHTPSPAQALLRTPRAGRGAARRAASVRGTAP